MIRNIENAVSNGIKYGADGMLITDWGNTPHLQYLTVSYAGGYMCSPELELCFQDQSV